MDIGMHWIPMFWKSSSCPTNGIARITSYSFCNASASSLRNCQTYTNGLLQSEVVFSLLFPVSCNIPHHLITYFIISFVNYIIFPLICNYFFHYFPVIFFRFRQPPLCFYFFLLSSPFTAICFPSFPHEFHPAAVPRRLSYRGIRDPFLMQCDAHNIRPVPLSPGSEVHPAHGSVPSR